MSEEARIFTKSGLQTAVAAARADERRRIAAITSLPEAAGRERLALTLATTTDQSVAEAKAALTSAPTHKAPGGAMTGDHADAQLRGETTSASATPPPVAATTQMAAPGAAVTGSQTDASTRLWDAVLRAHGMRLQGDAPTPGMMPASPPNPPPLPDWDALLQSRGMNVG
jgi:hypothetical protein